MLVKENRLRKNKDFALVFKKGKTIRGEFLDFKIIRNNQKISRFGFVTDKNLSKRAVIRNKIIRRLKRVFRKKLNNIKDGFDVVVIARPGSQEKDFPEIEKAVDKMLLNASIEKEE